MSDNIEGNRRLWDSYASNWDPEKIDIQNRDVAPDDRKSYLQHVGDEWCKISEVKSIVAEYITPFINRNSTVAEIGSGGGRVASMVAGNVKTLSCFDISAEMLKKAREALSDHANIEYFLLDEARFPDQHIGAFDFVYSFDVFVHLDLHTIWKYFKEIGRVLKDGGRAFLHTANLGAPGGWEIFSRQDAYRIETFYFISPEIIRILAAQGNYKLIKESTPDPKNNYLNRDYLFVIEKDTGRKSSRISGYLQSLLSRFVIRK